MSKENKKTLAVLLMTLMGIQQGISNRLFSCGSHLGEQHISTRPNYALTSKVREQYRKRMVYLAQHGKRK